LSFARLWRFGAMVMSSSNRKEQLIFAVLCFVSVLVVSVYV
jgi:hypothetical protein